MGTPNLDRNPSQAFEFKDVLYSYLHHWKWFVVSMVVAIILARVYLRYSTPQFEAVASIRLTSLKTNPSPEEALLGELGLVYGGDKLHTDEIQILRSRLLIADVVRDLEFYVQVFSEGNIKDVELYGSSPIKVTYFDYDSIEKHEFHYFEISIVSDSTFLYTDEYGIEVEKRFGSEINTPIGNIVITPSQAFSLEKFRDEKLKVLIRSVESVVGEYREKFYAFSLNDQIQRSNMIKLGITDPVPEKAELFINTLVEFYNKRSIDNKKEVAKSTFDFINERIALISNDLDQVDSAKERFKVGNTLTDVTSEAGIYVQAEAVNEAELLKLGTELNTVEYMLRSLKRESEGVFNVIPTNIGLNDASIGAITAQYNQFVLDRDRLLRNSGVNNPVVQQLDDRLNGLKLSLIQSLENLKNTLLIRESNLKRQSELLDSKIADVPGQERQNRDIQRQQNIKESIYLYLLQKREESAITMATANPSAEIIDLAEVDRLKPVSPKGKLIYLAFGIFGLFIPFALIFIKNLVDTKVYSRRDLAGIRDKVKTLGELPRLEGSSSISESGTLFSEALRVIRTNLNFLSTKTPGQAKVIFVTSSINGEGKSFLAYHLARVYAFTNSKVLLIGADIRKPNLQEYLKIDREFGLSDYLNSDMEVEDIITQIPDVENFSVLHSGNIPPNPAELLLSDRLEALFESLRSRYDFIIVDTAPTMLVTDTLLLGKFADQTLYVVRSGYTDKEILHHIADIAFDEKLPNMSLVLNDVDLDHLGYNQKYRSYSSYITHVKSPWYRRLYKKLWS